MAWGGGSQDHMASLTSFEEIMEFRLAELRSQLAAEHELAVQQAISCRLEELALENSLLKAEMEVVGQHTRQLAQENNHLRSELEVLRLVGEPNCSALLASREAWKALLECFYREDESLELFSALLEDRALCRLQTAQRSCRECFRETVGTRRAQLLGPVKRTISNASLVSTRSSEAKWISIAEPTPSRRNSFRSEPPDASPLGRTCSTPAAGSGQPWGFDDAIPSRTLSQEDTLHHTTSAPQLVAGEPGQVPPTTPSSVLSPGATLAGVREEDEVTGNADAACEAPAEAASQAEEPRGAHGEVSKAEPVAEEGTGQELEGREEAEPVAEEGRGQELEGREEAEPVAEEGRGQELEGREEVRDVGNKAVEEAPQADEVVEAEPPRVRKVPALWDVLRWAKPSWTLKERTTAQVKLGKLGVLTTEDLAVALLDDKINDRLRAARLQTFTAATLQALSQCISERMPPPAELAVSAGSQVPVNGASAPVQGKDLELLLGVWLCKEGFSFEIRHTDDGGYQTDMDPAPSGLWYYRRLAVGQVLAGGLRRGAEEGWPWEAQLQDGSHLRLRLDGPKSLTCQTRAQSAETWQQEVLAERPDAYAFFNNMDNKEGHRYVHFPVGESAGEFPIVGLTAGWLPASLSQNGKEMLLMRDSMVPVTFLGDFCDPFNVVTHSPLQSRVREIADTLPVAASGFSQRQFGRAGRGYAGGNPWGIGTDQSARVAKHLNISVQHLRDHALFRGRARVMPQKPCNRDMAMSVGPGLVKLAHKGAPPRPLLSLILVRFYNYWSQGQHSSDYNILNDGFFNDLLNGPNSPGRLLPGQVEIYTIFLRQTADLSRLRPAHLRSMLRGKNVSAWYFLWPSGDGEPGMVRERDFFRFCQSMERLPVRMGWPHQSSVYRLLCGKLWIPQMSLNSKFRVPPTVRVHYADFKQNPRRVAQRAIDSLLRLRSKVWGKSTLDPEDLKGVVKLGFSWCGSDVLPFRGVTSLQKNLGMLLSYPSCESTSCLVQEMVPGVVGEFRVLVMQDRKRGTVRKETAWMLNGAPSESVAKHRIHTTDVADFSMASHLTVDNRAVAGNFFRGDASMQARAEEQALCSVRQWLNWYSTETPEPPQTTRIDFLVSTDGPNPPSVWTCEVGENGGSLCTVEVHGRNLAAVNRAIIKDDTGRFPLEFPARIPRNNGEKG